MFWFRRNNKAAGWKSLDTSVWLLGKKEGREWETYKGIRGVEAGIRGVYGETWRLYKERF